MVVTATDQTVEVAKGTKLDVNNFAGDVNVKVSDKDAVREEVNHSDRETVDIKQMVEVQPDIDRAVDEAMREVGPEIDRAVSEAMAELHAAMPHLVPMPNPMPMPRPLQRR